MKLRGDAAIEQEVARVVETELSRGQVGFLLTFVLLLFFCCFWLGFALFWRLN